jgi:hypothetical protein
MSTHLPEAAMMEEYCRERPGQTMAGLDFLDLDQSHRLSLEHLTQGANGCLYEEQEHHSGGDTLPVHLRSWRKFYLNKVKDFDAVQSLLEAMKRFYPTPGVTATKGIREAKEWFTKKSEKLKDPAAALEAMTEYFNNLADQLEELDSDDGVTNADDALVGAVKADRDNFECTVPGYTMYINAREPRVDHGYTCGQLTRQVLVHNPNGDKQKDWILRQSTAWQSCFFGMRKCRKLKALQSFNEVIRRNTEKKIWKGSQLRVLWDMYFSKRDYLREQVKQLAARNMGITAERLLSSIDRQDEARKMGKVGACLYAWSKGEPFNGRKLPGTIDQPEWAVIWDAYRAKKAELQEAEAQLEALKE